ncbi:MAG: rhodanese-like domain-containing protein [Gammaproteobacteria bacterium]|nr:rhodanese-like domain-containing protein [Gammaproteobacteria bacterium]
MSKTLMDYVNAAREAVSHLGCDQLQDFLETKPDLLVVDVREESEYAAGHIPGAILVPRGILEGAADLNYGKRDQILSEARKRPIVVYCATGGRSAMAALTLIEMGYAEVYNLAGGFVNWEADDLPVESP